MQALVIPSGQAPAPLAAPVPRDAGRLAVYDDAAEWSVFSRQDGDVAPAQWESRLVVQGMHCAACSLAVERALLGVPGVLSARVSAASGRASVVWSAALTLPSRWMGAPLALGYAVLPASDAFTGDAARTASRLALWRWLVAGFCMMQVMMYAYPAYIAGAGDITPDLQQLLRWASWVLTLPVLLFSCAPFFSNALRDLRHRSISMDLPVALGIAVTFAISTAATFEPAGWWAKEVYFDSLTMFVFFLLTGRWLEQRLRVKTAGSLEALMQRLPDSVERQLASGGFERVAARCLQAGDVVRVAVGEAFPGDGTVIWGDTLADEALLTGESHPVARPTGASVLAGSHNLSAPVLVRLAQIGCGTRYAQIVALMAQASVDKPRLALLADRVAKPFLGFVLLAAAGALVFWWRVDPARAVMAAVAVLVVTCPCALSLATPVAMLTSAGWLARQGVLVRRLQGLEALSDIDTVIFDKTGTLTEARMGLRQVETRRGVTAAQALQLAGALAQYSLHPASRALALAAQALPALPGESGPFCVTGIREQAGQGVEGQLDTASAGRILGLHANLKMGSARFCDAGFAMPFGEDRECGAGHEDHRHEQGQGVGPQVYLADAQGWLARFELEEVVRPDARQAIAALQAAGLQVEMLSGDRSEAALRVAGLLGISKVQGGCTPADKLAQLQVLQKQGRKVLMVGDGLNDGPVLAGAHASVALGAAVPLAQAQCDFVLPGAQLMLLPAMLAQSRRTLRVVRQNLWWAAIYNAVCVPMALAGWLPAWLAGLGMALSSLLVIANAARLARPPGRTVPVAPEVSGKAC